jgi:hypothetical protein
MSERERQRQSRDELAKSHPLVLYKMQILLSIKDGSFEGAVVQFCPSVSSYVDPSFAGDEIPIPAYAVKADCKTLTAAMLRAAAGLGSTATLGIRGGMLDPPYWGGRMNAHMKAMAAREPEAWSWAGEEFTLEDFKQVWRALRGLCTEDDWDEAKWIIFGTPVQVRALPSKYCMMCSVPSLVCTNTTWRPTLKPRASANRWCGSSPSLDSET